MRALTLRLYEDRLPAGCPPVFLPALPRALYVAEGHLTVEGPDDGQWLATGTARVSQQPATLLAETGFNISEAARRLGMHRRTLTRKLGKQRV